MSDAIIPSSTSSVSGIIPDYLIWVGTTGYQFGTRFDIKNVQALLFINGIHDTIPQYRPIILHNYVLGNTNILVVITRDNNTADVYDPTRCGSITVHFYDDYIYVAWQSSYGNSAWALFGVYCGRTPLIDEGHVE